MVKNTNIEFNYEKQSKKIATKTINKEAIVKALRAIEEGKKIRDLEGPKFYGVACGC